MILTLDMRGVAIHLDGRSDHVSQTGKKTTGVRVSRKINRALQAPFFLIKLPRTLLRR